MRNCLLCSQAVEENRTFSSLILLQKEQNIICKNCRAGFEAISSIHCPRCWKEGETEVCSDCQIWEAQGYLVKHQACFLYNDLMKDFFSKYKFQGDYLLRFVFAEVLKKSLRNFKEYTLVPIPVSPEKHQSRGFNQVEGFLQAAGLPYKQLLEKEDMIAQSSKNREERLNSQQCFTLAKDVLLPEKILLIDDVYTTGKTLQLARELLLEAGVKEVLTFSLAR
ncbi:ComF family protein [Streptococcus cristatus]|uniref:ComF family protein n=1 Tax=Streptococcus cristatus TaxID=45634 RepID=UPI0005EEFEC5|nr:ComF family protein [Streptococcus cristatus]KJQ58162.1 late competence protein [Streptococcus cristatus]QIP48957.1 ComF family protein [Streptococcus cristatus ATCC 51100]